MKIPRTPDSADEVEAEAALKEIDWRDIVSGPKTYERDISIALISIASSLRDIVAELSMIREGTDE